MKRAKKAQVNKLGLFYYIRRYLRRVPEALFLLYRKVYFLCNKKKGCMQI